MSAIRVGHKPSPTGVNSPYAEGTFSPLEFSKSQETMKANKVATAFIQASQESASKSSHKKRVFSEESLQIPKTSKKNIAQ